MATAQVDEVGRLRQDSFAYVDQTDDIVCVCGIIRLTKYGIAVEGGSIKITILQNRRLMGMSLLAKNQLLILR